MDVEHSVAVEGRASFSGLTPAEVHELTSTMLQEDESKINAMRDHMLQLKRTRNSVALLNAKLPREILTMVFRLAGPWTSPQAAIRLTHICHAWREIIHGTPIFWKDFLYLPDRKPYIRFMNHPSVVFDALARAPPTPIALAMHGDSIPALRAPAAEPYLSRIRSLYLDCRAVRDRDMRPFFELNFPSMQTLRIELHCALTALPANIPAESPARFPKLMSLGTSCAGFPLAWVGPSLRMLDISCKGKETQTDLGVRKMHCKCSLSASQLFGTLGRCPDLEYLSLNTCLPSPRRDPDTNSPGLAHHPPSPRLDRLVLVRIADRLDRVRAFSEPFMTIAHRIKELVICTKSPYDDLLGFLPAANRLESISVIDQVRITVCRPAPDFVHVVQGLAKDADGASRTVLKVHSNAAVPCNSDLDLQRLFRGFAPTFLPTVLVDLGVTLGKPVPSGQSEAWVWLFRHFPKIKHLSLDSASSRDLFAALAQEDVAPALRNLKLSVVLTGAEDWVAEYEEAVSALETRASRGLALGSLRYRPKVKRGTGELPPPMPTSYVQRIQAVVGQVTLSAPYYTH